MLRQALTTGARAARSVSRASSVSASLARPQFQPALASRLRAAQPAATRWYSSEKAEEAPKEGEEAKEETELDALKKKFEAKEKEALDWKVCRVSRFWPGSAHSC